MLSKIALTTPLVTERAINSDQNAKRLDTDLTFTNISSNIVHFSERITCMIYIKMLISYFL